MAHKRSFQDADSDDTAPEEKRQRTNLQSAVLEAVKANAMPKFWVVLEPMLRRVVSEEVERAIAKYLPSKLGLNRLPSKQLQGSESTSLRLQFQNKISLPLYTGCKVEGEHGNAIQVVLQDAVTGELVIMGDESLVRLDIVVLEGDFSNDDEKDWTSEEFENYVVKEREGKRPLLTGDLSIPLKEGIGTLGELIFTDNSSWIRSRKFRLGVKIPTGCLNGSPLSPPLPEKSASFAKTLTQSDANNGGGFSVPRYCAETIFPRLDYSEDPPVQIVLAKDVHGTVWKFRHIYRGTPRRHLLTTGWSNFVNQKKLVAGDAIVFLRSATGELCVGVRRSARGTVAGGDTSSWHLCTSAVPSAPPRPSSRWELKPADNSYDFFGAAATDSSGGAAQAIRTSSDMVGTVNFARNRARVTANAVLEAASLAAAGRPFEVVYYPRASISEFCVKATAVRAALQQSWAPGMRFKMAVETEDASRISWFMGTISKVQEADPMRWHNSPWKILQVTWDEPDLLQGIVRVSPWQVELVSPMQLPPFSLPKKKVRLLQPPELQIDGQGIMGLSMAALASNLLGHISPWHGFADNIPPAGMQGARHEQSYGLTIPDFRHSNSQPSLFWESFYKAQEHPIMSGARVSTDLNMSSFGSEGCRSRRNHLSTLLTVGSSSSGPALSSNGLGCDRGGSSSSKSTPFLLFGKAIDTSQSAKSQPLQLSSGSSSDGQGHETFSDGNQSEALDKMHMLVSGQGNQSKQFGGPILLAPQGEALDSTSNEVGTLNWFKEQANFLDREKPISTIDNSFNHCKVFRESDEVGRIVDLSMFDSYEELHEKLSLMFGIQKSEILSRVVCVDSMGTSRPIGNEPYRDFTKRVRRLKILSESSSESITR